MTLDQVVSRAGWLTVVTTALTLSAWSLYWVARRYGLPVPLAAIVSASFDGAAIVCADLALKYARSYGDSGLGPRLGVFALAGISAYLNMQHAVIDHDPFAARILYAAPPVVSVTMFEFHSRWERRGALRRAGRVPAALPVFGRWAWVLFPFRTLGVLRRITATRLEFAELSAGVRRTPGQLSGGSGEPSGGSGEPSGGLGELPGGSEPSAAVVRAWARIHGITVPLTGPVPETVKTTYRTMMLSNGHHSP